jgi:methyl-accepting chemotaxis protein
MIRFLRNLKLSRKLVLIGLCFMLPMSVLFYFTFKQVDDAIGVSKLELSGTQYVRPLARLLKRVGDHQLLARQFLAGEKDLYDRLLAKQTEIDDDFRDLDAVNQRLGRILQFTPEGLAERAGEKVTAPELAKRWEDLERSLATLTPDASDERHLRLLEGLRAMIHHVGDSSNLILDPELDTYYMINAAVVMLPQAQYRLARAIATGYRMLAQKEITLKDRVEIGALASILKDVDVDGTVQDVETAIREDAQYHGVSESLQSNMRPALQSWGIEIKAFIEILRTLAESRTDQLTPDEFMDAGVKAREATYAFRVMSTDEADRLLAVRIDGSVWFRRLIMAMTIMTLGIAVLLFVLVARSITVPVAQCVQSLNALAAKDLTPRTRIEGRDELGQMSAAVAHAVEGLREGVQSMGRDADVLSHASASMVSSSQQMSTNAEETATQANAVSTAAEQVSKSVQSVALATQEMSASIREVAQQATDAARVATSGVKVAQATNTTVVKLGSSSQEIGKVIKVITSIAEQTNLLALNATIEAARVGEAGRGFVVVANEVKELARETARATEEISLKIEAIQGDSRDVVAAISQLGASINQINDIQTTIASAVEEQTVTTREIGRNVAEAASGTSEIARNIMGVAEAARNTSEGAHHTQQAAGDLSRMAADLKSLVGSFKCE